VIAIESALPALEQRAGGENWVGWSYWAQALEHAGHVGPARQAQRYALHDPRTVDLPKQWGPLRGLPRNPKPLLRLLDETTLPEDYRKVGSLTLERIDDAQRAGRPHLPGRLGLHRHLRLPPRAPARRPLGAAAFDRLGALRAARATARRSPRRSSTGCWASPMSEQGLMEEVED
jgi:hypothetical protein